MQRVIREQMDAIEAAGFTVDFLEHGRHLKAYISLNGQKYVMPISSSPSGGRWLDNFSSRLRRIARQATSPSP